MKNPIRWLTSAWPIAIIIFASPPAYAFCNSDLHSENPEPHLSLFPNNFQHQYRSLSHYGYRYYNASAGRWLSRDPIGEQGGPNLCGFIGNDPVDEFDVLGKYSSNYRFSLAEMQTMLRQSKEDFRRKVKALCPISVNVAWTTVHGQKQCCTPDGCRVQADALTLEFAQQLTVNFTAEYQRFGNVLAFTPLWIPGQTINDRANMAPHHGQVADDYNQGYGLKCIGMQNLMQLTFLQVMRPLHRSGHQCFKAALLGNSQSTSDASHHWLGIYGPFSDDVHEPDVIVDPWFSAGGIISPNFVIAQPQYFIPVLW